LAISGERSHASRRTDDQDAVRRLYPSRVAESLQAANAEMGKTAACYNVMLRGFIASASLR
jgi:hypothetical protein